MVLVSLTLIATGAIIYFLGIYIGILFMLPVCMFIHGERNVKLLAGLTVVICVFVWLSFDVALRVPLLWARCSLDKEGAILWMLFCKLQRWYLRLPA